MDVCMHVRTDGWTDRHLRPALLGRLFDRVYLIIIIIVIIIKNQHLCIFHKTVHNVQKVKSQRASQSKASYTRQAV